MKNRRDYKIFAAISDIHIGVKHIPAKELKKQLRKNSFDVLDSFSVLDGIFVCGDLSHTILSFNSDYANLYLWFCTKLYKLAKRKDASVIIVRGTPSHDNAQLDNVQYLVDQGVEEGVDFRIYDTYEEITVWDDYKVLVLPDLKVKDDKEIEQYFKIPKRYDLVLGHGMIETFQFVTQESENMPTKQYVYKLKDLQKVCKGPCLFGHIHQFANCGNVNQIYYTGPFTLLERGGRSAGFVVGGIYDKDRSRFRVEHYDNPDAGEYYDLEITPEMIKELSIDDLVEAIQELADEAKDNDLFTLRINREDDMGSADKVLILETRFKRDRRFSIIKKILSEKEIEREAKIKERKDKYAYLLDETIELPEILWSYYQTDIKPTIPDQTSLAASLTEQDFKDALEVKDSKVNQIVEIGI